MAKLFMIECYQFTTDMIEVVTDKGTQWISTKKFETWVDRNGLRLNGAGDLIDWDLYYDQYFERDGYDYLVIRGGSSLLLDIKTAIDKCLN